MTEVDILRVAMERIQEQCKQPMKWDDYPYTVGYVRSVAEIALREANEAREANRVVSVPR